MTLAKETVGSPVFVASLFAKNSPYAEAYNKQYSSWFIIAKNNSMIQILKIAPKFSGTWNIDYNDK